MATKKIQIEFDMNTNEVKLAGEATLSLAQQVRILQKELQKTPEGTKEFELLRRKLNDTKDNFDRVNAKSRELFGTLSLIPGPIGEVAGKLNGAISLFKTFSGFSLKDLRGQFTGLIDDLKGVLNALGGWATTTKETTKDLSNLDKNTQTLDTSVNSLNTTTGALVSQQAAAAEELKKVNEVGRRNADVHGAQYVAVTKETQGRDAYVKSMMRGVNVTNTSIEGYKNLKKMHEQNFDNLQKQAQVTEEVSKRTTIATGAVRLFAGALTAIGIGILIGALTTVIGKLYDFITGTAAAKKATEEFTFAIQEQNYWLEYNANEAKRNADVKIAQMKAEGASAKQIRDFELQEAEKFYLESEKNRNEAYAKEEQAQKGNNVDIMNATIDDYRKKNQVFLEAEANVKKLRFRNQEEDKKDLKKVNEDKAKIQKDANDKADKLAADRLAERKAQLDAAIQLEINSENTRKDVLEKLLKERLELEKLIGDTLLLQQQENATKVTEAILEDYEKKRQMQLTAAEAAIQIEQSQADVNTERLIELLAKRRDIELEEDGLTAQQKLAIQAQYEADFRKLRQESREKQLVEDIQASRGDFDKQIELYRQFGEEVLNSTNYTEGERLRIIQETNEKIQQLQKERFENEINELQLENGELFAYDQAYYDSLNQLYDAEEQRYKELFEQKKITEAEYNAFLIQNRDARIQIGKEELAARLATLDALGNAFGAAAQLAGDQTKLGKGLAVASATVDTYSAANKVMNDPTPIPFFLRLINAAAIVFRGLANVRRILQVQVPTAQKTEAQFAGGVINVNQRRAQGGMINGPGGETTDSIPALLSDGEYVVNSRSTRMFRPLLETINSASNLPAFAVGGLVSGNQPVPFKSQNETIADAISTAFGSTPIRTYVTANEVSTQQQFDRIIKSRSLI